MNRTGRSSKITPDGLFTNADLKGGARFAFAQIATNLNCDGATFEGGANFNTLRCGGSGFFRGTKFESDEETNLAFASFGVNLYCDNVTFSGPANSGSAKCNGSMTLNEATFKGGAGFSGMECDGDGLFTNAAFDGELDLLEAKIGGNLYFDGARLNNSDGDILVGERCQVGGVLSFRLREQAVGRVNFAYAQVGTLVDDLANWPDHLTLVGFSYRSLSVEASPNVKQRLKWLSRSKPFSPDVYTQLTEAYRRSGEEDRAKEVAIAREKERTRQSDLSWWVQAWRGFLGLTAAYGYRPRRALVFFVLLLALGSLFFAQPAAKHAMVPAPDTVRGPASAAEDCKNYPCFSPFFYTFDALVPFIDFHQESSAYWVPATDQRWGWWNAIITWLLTVLGWILLVTVAAGVASLWRRE
jgi:hypothetical protein